eukprot:CAMPEP_0201483168 /NCGR_PEP_ID=MMETSP0151_2-20130828/7387_1 /ASSEMBLY_ACC=CAM_ASM_000257 /TAXON_ID=200890 /ORGANISM="Paramoeba atlantica, Strain 621/1 / CCAP 1560/9" /LENGTH=234 /DNA_ID=CAMNT_0047866179 /DNA_START=130 /DNA_END=834 /DNA_ORIENTATION=+
MIAFFFLIGVVGVLSEDFHPNRVHFIDKTPDSSNISNSLFRGNEPTENHRFAYDDLVKRLREVAVEEGHFVLPEKFFLVDVCLLDEEEWSRKVEEDFFKNNPDLGKVVWRPTIGQVLPPEHFAPPERKQMSENLTFDEDHLINRIPELHESLFTDYGMPTVFYVHCEAGVDRTGEVSGSYYIRWLGWSWEQALDYDNSVIDRDMETLSRNAMQWYCYHLYYWQNFTSLDCDLEQ